MSDRLFVGTRKGLFTIERRDQRWEIAQVAFLGDPATMFLHDRRDGTLYCVLTLGHFGVKLHRSADDGITWAECAVPVYPEGAEFGLGPMAPEDGPQTKPASLTEIWALEAGGSDQPGRLWAGTIPGGLFRSDDGGDRWTLVESLWNRKERMEWFGGGKDDPGIHSICVDPRDSRHVRLAISCGGVWQTTDDGQSWQCRGDGLRAEFMPPNLMYNPNIQDAHRMAQCHDHPDVLWIQHHNGIFRTTDGAQTWHEFQDVKPSGFGFAVCAHPHDAQTAWFVPGVKDECRVPVDGRLVVTRTRDGGETFESLGEGLPQQECYDIVYRHAMDVDPAGDQLAMGSTTGNLWLSDDGGETWQTLSQHLPPVYCVQFART